MSLGPKLHHQLAQGMMKIAEHLEPPFVLDSIDDQHMNVYCMHNTNPIPVKLLRIQQWPMFVCFCFQDATESSVRMYVCSESYIFCTQNAIISVHKWEVCKFPFFAGFKATLVIILNVYIIH